MYLTSESKVVLPPKSRFSVVLQADRKTGITVILLFSSGELASNSATIAMKLEIHLCLGLGGLINVSGLSCSASIRIGV